jgi:hypothetical protein
MLAPTTTNPAHLSWERCRGIHPMRLGCLCAAFIDVLADTAGIEPDRLVFEPLRCIRTIGDLARFPWAALCAQLSALAQRPCPRIEEAVAHLQLFAELAVVHHYLYLARSGSTLKLLGRCRLPLDLPPELSSIRDDFGQLLVRADRDLQAGRSTLAHFRRQVATTRHPLPALGCTVLARARACYQRYRRAIKAAHDVAGRVAWYLAWVEEPGGQLPACAAQHTALSAPTPAARMPQSVGQRLSTACTSESRPSARIPLASYT